MKYNTNRKHSKAFTDFFDRQRLFSLF